MSHITDFTFKKKKLYSFSLCEVLEIFCEIQRSIQFKPYKKISFAGLTDFCFYLLNGGSKNPKTPFFLFDFNLLKPDAIGGRH